MLNFILKRRYSHIDLLFIWTIIWVWNNYGFAQAFLVAFIVGIVGALIDNKYNSDD